MLGCVQYVNGSISIISLVIFSSDESITIGSFY